MTRGRFIEMLDSQPAEVRPGRLILRRRGRPRRRALQYATGRFIRHRRGDYAGPPLWPDLLRRQPERR